ncbi:MAG: ribonucleoside-diphosphate reductase subunit alpha, partial [Anaerococcus sp.]|nr:ribonucleoside-diphosphate reductase subunit alpha [Anaerococcus sp.]
IWHKDMPEFLGLKTNNGDDRMKAHDIFPGVCFPDYFWELSRDDINATWYMFDPHEVEKKYGKALEDTYGDEWKEFYLELIEDKNISRRTMPVKEMVRLLIKSWTETGTPFVFNRDAVNKMNPNKHKGMIYSSNLCTEIAQNMSPSETVSTEIIDENGDTIIVNKTKPGDFVECNLASLTLGKIDVTDQEELEETVRTIVRALDNVIDLNYYPTPYAEVTNKKYRAIGLGTSGYHHMLVKNDVKWTNREAHGEFVDKVYEDINYYAILESMEIAKEKGSYKEFKGSDWQTGAYFELRDYNSDRWEKLKENVAINGLRNGYLMAIAPTGSTSIISGTSAGVDPIMSRYFLEEKKGAIVPRVAPGLTTKTFWLYENAHDIDQNISMEMAGVRQRHIDQAQSINIYITNEYTMRQILNVYIKAWESGVKSIYYVRGKSLEVEECDSCAS